MTNPAQLPDVSALDLPDTPAVVVLAGPSGAGKSALADHIHTSRPSHEVIAYDACRTELCGNRNDQQASAAAVDLALDRLHRRCRAGLGTILDGTHHQADARHRVITAAALTLAGIEPLPLHLILLATDLHTCQARQLTQPDPAPGDLPTPAAPAAVVAEHHARLTASLPTLDDEGWDGIHVVTGPHVKHIPCSWSTATTSPWT